MLDRITSHSELSKDRQRSSTVQGCPHLHVRERDRNYCDLKHFAVLRLKSSMCTRPDNKVIQKQTVFCITCMFWRGKQLFSHCLWIAMLCLYVGLQQDTWQVNLQTLVWLFHADGSTHEVSNCLSRDLSLTPKMLFLSSKNSHEKHILVLISHSCFYFVFRPCVTTLLSQRQSRPALPLYPSKHRIRCYSNEVLEISII